MKNLLLILFYLPFVVVAQQPFSINGNIKNLKNGDKIYLIYKKGDDGITDTASVIDGSFKFTGSIAEAAFAYIALNKNPFTTRPKKGEVIDFSIMIVEPGQISLSGKDSIHKAVVAGAMFNPDFQKYKASVESITEKEKSLNAKLSQLTREQLSDESVTESFFHEMQTLNYEKNSSILSFVQTNPTSYLNLLLLPALIRDPQFFTHAKSAFEKFTPPMKATSLAKSISEKIAALEKTAIGSMAMDFEQNDVNGKPVKLSDFKGKYVLIDFWASWCAPCRQENPYMVAAYQKYKDRGFTILGVSADKNKIAWLKAIADDKLKWTQVCDLTEHNPVLKLYGIKGIPSNFLIDPTGKILASGLRGNDLEKKLEEIFNK